ncbi:MIP/aquaporin family protein [Thorsellia kenyensis]|uniref:MIP/aquaporin family protein n=1 Tax=Thorsellia kenyensis TaxID=1549888 RepID=A0ABV6CCN4_9GAMM
MENKLPQLGGQCVAEALGTLLFLFLGIGSVAALKLTSAEFGQWEISIIWGFSVALAIYLTSGVSGAHLNPAVTVCLWMFGRCEGKKVIPFIISQMIGAFLGAALVYLLYANLLQDFVSSYPALPATDKPVILEVASIFSTYPHPKITWLQAFQVELVTTAILMCLIFALTDEGNGLPRGALAPLLIGILIAVIGASIGPLTGFAMNPARDFGPKLFTYLVARDPIVFIGNESVPYFWIPIIAPIVGALIGASIYRFAIKTNLPKHVS